MLLREGKIDEDQSGAVRLLNHVLFGGQLIRWRRKETGPGEEVKERVVDSFAALFSTAARGPF